MYILGISAFYRDSAAARSEKMQSVMSLKIKIRESFRPFVPIFKLIDRYPLQRRPAPRSNSYWQIHQTYTDPAAYYRQF